MIGPRVEQLGPRAPAFAGGQVLLDVARPRGCCPAVRGVSLQVRRRRGRRPRRPGRLRPDELLGAIYGTRRRRGGRGHRRRRAAARRQRRAGRSPPGSASRRRTASRRASCSTANLPRTPASPTCGASRAGCSTSAPSAPRRAAAAALGTVARRRRPHRRPALRRQPAEGRPRHAGWRRDCRVLLLDEPTRGVDVADQGRDLPADHRPGRSPGSACSSSRPSSRSSSASARASS